MKIFKSFSTGTVIGTLGGLMGLGGAEFRLPVLVGMFRFTTIQAIIINILVSLVTVFFSFLFRSGTVGLERVAYNWAPVADLLAGSLFGSWLGAHLASKISSHWLERAVMVLLAGLSVLLMAEHWLHFGGEPLFGSLLALGIVGAAAGVGIGIVSSLLGVAGGELLIPIFMLLFGLEIKLAGSLALAVSFPTLIVGIIRYSRTEQFAVAGREKGFIAAMAAGSILGAFIGSLALGIIPSGALSLILGIILMIAAIKIFYRTHH